MSSKRLFGCLCSHKIGVLTALIIELLFHSLSFLGVAYYFLNSGYHNSIVVITLLIGATTVGLLAHGRRKSKPQYLWPYLAWKPIQLVMEICTAIYYCVFFPQMKEDTILELREETDANQEQIDYVVKQMTLQLAVDMSLVLLYTLGSILFVYIVFMYRKSLMRQEISYHYENHGNDITSEIVLPSIDSSAPPPAYSKQEDSNSPDYQHI